MAFKKPENKSAEGGKPKAGAAKSGPKAGRGGVQSSRGPSKFAKSAKPAGRGGEGRPSDKPKYGARGDSERKERSFSPRGKATDRPTPRGARSRDDAPERPKRSYSRDSEAPAKRSYGRTSEAPAKRSYAARDERDDRRPPRAKPSGPGARTGDAPRGRGGEDRFDRPKRAGAPGGYDRPKRASASGDYDRPKRASASSDYDRPKRASSSGDYDRSKRASSSGDYDRPKRAVKSDEPEAKPSRVRSASFNPNKGLVKRATGVRSFYPDEKPARHTTKRDGESSRPARGKPSQFEDKPKRSYAKADSGEERGRPAKEFVPRPRTGPKSATGASTYKKVEKETDMASKTATATKPSSPVASTSKSAAADAPPAKPRTKLRAEDMRKLKDMMLQERQRIIQEMRILDDRSLQGSSDENGQQPGFSLQLADSASDNIQIETDLGIRNIEAEQLSQLDEALRAMDGGEYGTCNRCHEPISIERLFARPNAKYCISCLKLLEAGKA